MRYVFGMVLLAGCAMPGPQGQVWMKDGATEPGEMSRDYDECYSSRRLLGPLGAQASADCMRSKGWR